MNEFNSIREVLAWLASGNRCKAFNGNYTLHMNEKGQVIDDHGDDLDLTTCPPCDFKKVRVPIRLVMDSFINEDGFMNIYQSQAVLIREKFKDRPGANLRITIEEVL